LKPIDNERDKAPTNPNAFRDHLVKAGIISSSWLLRFQEPNGADRRITVKDVWLRYCRDHLPTISESSRHLKTYRCERFLPPLFPMRMCELTPQALTEFIHFTKANYVQRSPSKKCNFDKELKDLGSIFKWYQDMLDYRFAIPLRPSHLKLGVIAEIPAKNRQVSIEQFHQFLAGLSDFYRDFALLQFFCGARVGEIAGLHHKNIDLERRVLKIQEVLVWINGKAKIKSCPKNGSSREVFINDMMLEILRRCQDRRQADCPLAFHREGRALLYNAIGAAYNRSWRKAGLAFSGTHLMRYLAAQQSRMLLGNIDAAKAVTGHKSAALAEKYSDYTNVDRNREALERLERALKRAG
jgi:integrase